MKTKLWTKHSFSTALITVLLLVAVPVASVFALTTSEIVPTANGNYTSWNSDFNVVNEGTGSPICNSNDYVDTSTTNNRESFVISLASIPNGSLITSVDVLVRDRADSSAGGTYATFVRFNGADSANSTIHAATAGSGSACPGSYTDTFDVTDTVKAAGTTLEIGVVKTGGNTNTVRVGVLSAVVTYKLSTTVTATAVTGTYGNTISLSATMSPAVSGKTINFTLNSVSACSGTTNASGIASCNATLSTNVGSYPTGVGASFTTDADYQSSSGTAALTVNARPITVTADAKSKVYGNADPALTYQITSGSLAGSDTISGALTRVAGENVGTRAITQGTLSAGTNYNLTYVGANLTITTRPITVTADGKSKTYGDVDPALTYQITSGSLAFSDSISGALARDAGENVGTYAITQGTVSAGSNYNLSYVSADLTITKATLTVTADDQSITYGDVDPAFTFSYSGFVSGDNSGDIDTPPTCNVAGAHSNAGSYTIACSGGVDNNYSFSYANGTLTVDKATLSVTADDQSISYGDSDPAFIFQYAGFKGSDTSAGIDTPPTCDVAGAHSNVGTYTIACSGGIDNNYSFSYTNGTLTVDKATLDVTADDQSITYGDTDPTFTFAYSGFVGADGAGDLTTEPTCSVAGAHSNAGSYTIACSGGVDESYDFNYVDGTLTVDQVTLDVTADDQSITYGDADPTFTFAYSGFVSGDTSADIDTPPACGVAGAHSDAGSYGIACSGGVDNNYVFSYTDGTLTVAKAGLTVTADNQFILVGDPDPAFTFQYSGFAGSDTSTVLDTEPTCGVSGAHSSAGTYPITCSGGSDNNYDFSYVDGTLTVSSVNNPPTDIALSNSAVDENKPVGTTVGALSTTDPDLGDTHTYSLVDNPSVCDGTDNASFQISGSNLQTNAIFDFETKSSYVICVETNDSQGDTFQKQFTITVNNLVETITATFKSVAARDGWVLESGETTNQGGTMNAGATTFLLGDNTLNRQYRSILSFNTSSLPDNAVITKVTIRIRRQGLVGTDPFTTHLKIAVDIRKGPFGTILLQLTDFQGVASMNAAGLIANNPRPGNWYLSNLKVTAYPFINKAGNTQFRLRFQKDDNNDLGADYLRFFSGNFSPAFQPVLIIQYHLP